MRQLACCIEVESLDSQIAKLCAFPHGDCGRSVISAVRSARAAVTLGRLTRTRGGQIASWNEGLFRCFCDAQAIDDLGSASWTPVGGIILDALAREELPTESAIIGLAAALLQAGVAARWSVRPRVPIGVAFGNRWFRCENSIAMRSDGVELELEVDAKTHHFKLDRQLWCSAEDRPGETPGLPLSLNSPTLDVQQILYDWPQSNAQAALADDGLAVRAAMHLLRTYAPDFATWVENAVSMLVMLHPEGSALLGGSSASRPGLIIVSRADPIELVESLVHEATHQYMFTATILDELHDGSDTRQYFSPLRRELRPFGGILAAYHVLCNLLVLYERLLEAQCPDWEECAIRIETTRASLRAIDAIVCENAALTTLGAMTCQVLHKRVEHALG